jgi:hypothetical protein
MSVPIRSNCFASTIRPSTYKDFQHYSLDQRNRAVADAMSWWELIKDCFNHFNHAKALACLFNILKCQEMLTTIDSHAVDFLPFYNSLICSRDTLNDLIDDGYVVDFNLSKLDTIPEIHLFIRRRDTVSGQFPLCCVPVISDYGSVIWDIVRQCKSQTVAQKPCCAYWKRLKNSQLKLNPTRNPISLTGYLSTSLCQRAGFLKRS